MYVIMMMDVRKVMRFQKDGHVQNLIILIHGVIVDVVHMIQYAMTQKHLNMIIVDL